MLKMRNSSNPRIPMLWVSLLAGAVCGAALVFFGQEPASVQSAGLYVLPEWGKVWRAVLAAYGRNLFWFLPAVLSGFSVVGGPVLRFLPFWKGLGDGFLTGSLLKAGWPGLPAALRVLCPGILTAIILLEGCSESLEQSEWLGNCVLGMKPEGALRGLQGFLIRYAGILLMLLLCACADTAAAVAGGILAG